MNELQLEVEALKNKMSGYKWIAVDEGWYQIIVDCDKELSAVDPHYKILQIKEKFGGLRYYIEPSETCYEDRRLVQIITKYEEIASKTCEATGEPGVLMRSIGGWFKTLNPRYAETSLIHQKYTPVDKQNPSA